MLHSVQPKLGKRPKARRYSLHEGREVWRWCEGSLRDNGKACEKAICKLPVVGRKREEGKEVDLHV